MLNIRVGMTRRASMYYGLISVESQKEMDRFLEMGLNYTSKQATPYKDKDLLH